MLKIRVKAGMSNHLLQASILYTTLCEQIEKDEKHLAWPQPHWEEARSHAISAVVLSTAVLEASINELFQQAIDKDINALASLTGSQFVLLKEVWNEVESFSILHKYQIVLSATDREPMPKGEEPFQSALSLIVLRNAILHFKPEWDDELKSHQTLDERLSHLFQPSELTAQTKGRMVWFPNKCLGAGCARWATDTVIKFSKEFSHKMGIRERFKSPHPNTR